VTVRAAPELLICPGCGGSVEWSGATGGAHSQAEESLRCHGCERTFASVAGIPDLRLAFPDPYLSRAEDTARARELAERFEELDFAGLLRRHWRREGKPEALAQRFVAGDLAGARRAEAYLLELERERSAPLTGSAAFLELGCGTAALAVAAARRGARVVATDASMRWLVLARKRLVEEGLEHAVTLVCTTGEDPALRERGFDVVAAADVIEHVERPHAFVDGARRLMAGDGLLFLSTPNRFSLGLEPHVRLWGVGLMPRRLAGAYVRALRRVPYDHVHLLSARSLRRMLEDRGLEPRIVSPAVSLAGQELYRGAELALVQAYNRLRGLALVRAMLLAVGPFFFVFAHEKTV